MSAAACSSVPQPGGHAQLAPYFPQRSALHISRTSVLGTKASMFAAAQWEKPFSAARAISRVISVLPLDKAVDDC